MNNNKFFKYILFILGFLNLISVIEILISKKTQEYNFLSIHTTKEVNLAIHLILAVVLIVSGVKQKIS